MKRLCLDKLALVSLAVVMALAAMCVGYARMQGAPWNRGVGNIAPSSSSCDCGPFTWVVSNDDGSTTDIETDIADYEPIDPGDDGGGTKYDRWGDQSSDDPSAPQTPGEPCARYDKDVALTTTEIVEDGRKIKVLLENAYPSYYPTVFFGLKCPDCAPGKITSIDIDNPYEYALTVTTSGVYVEQVIPAGEEVVGAVHVHVEQAAQQNHVYTFKVLITIECQPCEWEGETAWSDGPEYRLPSFEMYTQYDEEYAPFEVDLLASSQKIKAGTVHFSAAVDGKVTITITLDPGWRFGQVIENVKVQDYAEAPPYGTNPAPGTFAHKGTATDSPFSIVVPLNNYYGVHVDVDRLDCS